MSDSYTSEGQSIVDHVRQISSLRRLYSQDFPSHVGGTLGEIRQAESRIWDYYKVRFIDLEVLEVGPGQLLGQMPYFSRNNRVRGADRDFIAQGPGPAQYLKMLRKNGFVRTFKTIGRKMLGVDRKYRQELCRTIGIISLPRFEVKQANADRLSFNDNTFDLVYSRAVFQHLSAPSDAIREITRVLKPGGVAYVSLHPYTSPTGCLDPRVLHAGIDNQLGLWPHLRPELMDHVKPNAYINKLGLLDWRRMFIAETTDPAFFVTSVDERYFSRAVALKEEGHLQQYAIEELTAGALDIMFRKMCKEERPTKI